MKDDVIAAKLSNIEMCLGRIETVTAGDPDALDDLLLEESVTLNLQRAIQSCLDIAAHVISTRPWPTPNNLREHFTILADNHVVPRELLPRLHAMIGFRNVVVHEYERVDRSIVKTIVAERLPDFDAFLAAIRAYVSASETESNP